MNTQWNAEVVTPVEEGAGTKVLDNQSNVQPTLEAGSNITIANGEISASGGGAEYTAGSGISIDENTISVDSDIRSGAAAGATAVQAADLATVATSGSYNDLSNKPSIPAAQIQSDWNQTNDQSADYIKNKPALATVATSGSYADLSNKPTIPTVDQVYDNTSANAQSGVAVASAISGKQDTISDLSTIRSGAEAGATAVQPSDLATVATSGSYNDLSNKPTIPTVAQSYNALSTDAMSGTAVAEAISGTGQVPSVTSTDNGKVLKATYEGGVGSFGWDAAPSGVPSTTSSDEGKVLGVTDNQGSLGWVAQTPSQVNADWNSSSGVSQILNKPTLATVATSGSYADLSNKPTIPTVDQSYSASSTNAQSGTAVAGALATVNQVPASTSADEDKVLTVNSSGTPVWAAAQGGSSYTAGDGIAISGQNAISAKVGDGLEIGSHAGSAVTANMSAIAYLGGEQNAYLNYVMQLTSDLVNKIETSGISVTLSKVANADWECYYANSNSFPAIVAYTPSVGADWGTRLVLSNTGYSIVDNKLQTGVAYDFNLDDINTSMSNATWAYIKANPTNYALTFIHSSSWGGYGTVYNFGNNTLSDSTSYITGSYNYAVVEQGFINVSNPVPAFNTSTDAGKVLTVGSNGTEWAAESTELPTVTGNAGKVLAVNSGATGVEWVNAPTELPSVTGNGGKILAVNAGATATEWVTKPTTPTVDQTYNSASTNAQSGTAVAGALATVNQVPASTSADEDKVLTVNSSGNAVWAAAQGGTTYTAGNMISLANDAVAVSTTAGITDIQVVNALPASPVATVLYLIPET